MADATPIEWTDATWNIVTGCSVVSPGCTNCYAMRLAGTRLQHHPSRAGLTVASKAGPVWNGQVRFNAEWLTQPLRWTKPRRIFVAAHGDLFHDGVTDDQLDQIFAVMMLADQHTYQILTKRPDRMRAYLTADDLLERLARAILRRNLAFPAGPAEADSLQWKVDPETLDAAREATFGFGPAVVRPWPLPNVWLGVSVEDQARADERIPILLDTPAAVRWISAEPLLGPVDLSCLPWMGSNLRSVDPFGGVIVGHHGSEDWTGHLNWVVAGGESGPGARPMHPDWARQLRDQCAATGVPFLFKQWGAWAPVCALDDDQVDRLYRPPPAHARGRRRRTGLDRCRPDRGGRRNRRHPGRGTAPTRRRNVDDRHSKWSPPVTERPILFSAPMVRALLDGRKTQTRRFVKRLTIDATGVKPNDGGAMGFRVFTAGSDVQRVRCPYGVPGDTLWVKETWADVNLLGAPALAYRADSHIRDLMDEPDWLDDRGAFNYDDPRMAFGKAGLRFCMWSSDLIAGVEGHNWRSPLHMPRWASRLTLQITDVRVERLQDISEADAEAEGVQIPALVPILGAFWSSRDGYARLWEHINGKGSWAANPWVWAVTFDVQARP